ncbi:MAG: 2Fe-2S iron-sulfur cluster-binding protein [Caulobacterales bacterium]|nr:2Fe-2S iron-sulfur cluster-binding protein [Caulobacterales bacterium]
MTSAEADAAQTIAIAVTDRDGRRRDLRAPVGRSLMEALCAADLPIEAMCGGCCACATCHVYVDPHWAERLTAREEGEQDMLEASAHFDEATSRLSCQILLEPGLEGLSLTLAPEE